MSCYLVSHDHIDLMLTPLMRPGHGGAYLYRSAGFAGDDVTAWEHLTGVTDPAPDCGIRIDRETATAVGQVLLRENLKSVQHRYPGDAPGEWPGTPSELVGAPDAAARFVLGYRFRPVRYDVADSAGAILLAVHGYRYQSCEHPGWKHSVAQQISDLIAWSVHDMVPGYDDADTWNYDRPLNGNEPVSVLDLIHGRP